MIKRAALARAIVMDPKLLFFDEPSAGLDPVVSAELDELILQLRDAMRMSIVVVTHELESAFKIADTITVLDQGNVLLTGTRGRSACQRQRAHPGPAESPSRARWR
jgi:phospholipid/cholesterol/gamma-HCH transport system ATP-binding protein